ncbi:unnamed protein product [Arctogadus glacialis]
MFFRTSRRVLPQPPAPGSQRIHNPTLVTSTCYIIPVVPTNISLLDECPDLQFTPLAPGKLLTYGSNGQTERSKKQDVKTTLCLLLKIWSSLAGGELWRAAKRLLLKVERFKLSLCFG